MTTGKKTYLLREVLWNDSHVTTSIVPIVQDENKICIYSHHVVGKDITIIAMIVLKIVIFPAFSGYREQMH